ncbi:branched-chain amino acid ABC transporter permease [Microbacterium invictum]|uniref:Branched-chain amino acid transport system permease protein n=1 Tax=Microbacterium invictum TaxID=515415 RepID=A0AA40VPG9_9MICO|nr:MULTISPECIES: branched-chain amino acid ABC transporter permease [Microbacterium]MBB4141318.1 branched-chain amino acid transport system permease protein [Microbacterium invictum]
MLQGALAGLAAGGLYAIMAVCLTVMARLVRVVNFAQVAVGMFGAFAAVTLSGGVLAPWLSAVIGLLVGALISAILGLIVAHWLSEADVSARSATTVAALLLLVSLSFILFGTKPLPFRPLFPGPAFTIGNVVISQVTVVLVILAIAVALVAKAVLTWTTLGIRLRALSERPTTAELVGIPSRILSVGVWVATGVVATFAVMVVAPSQSNDATTLSLTIIPAAAAALAGGFRRLDLAVVGGLVLGMLEGALAQTGSLTIVRYFVPFLVIVALLLWMQRREVWDVAR